MVSADTVGTYDNLVIKRENVETFKNLFVKAKFLVPRLTSFLKELNRSEISSAEKSFSTSATLKKSNYIVGQHGFLCS